jgi:hypothetical protein
MAEKKHRKTGRSADRPDGANQLSDESVAKRIPPIAEKSHRRPRASRKRVEPPPTVAPATRADGADGDWNAPRAFAVAREEMIRIAAYYIAEERGFSPGAELDDWLAAEIAIDAKLNE